MTESKNIQRNTSGHNHRERGQAFVFIGLSLIVLIAAVGLATDATLLYRAKQDLQRTIDSAALAAAYRLPSESNASKAAYEFARLHGYDFDPSTHPLQISFPTYSPPRKAVSVDGTTNVNFAFLSVIGFHTMQISAQGEAEAAPLDVYLVLDLSESMTYDTFTDPGRPNPWPPADWPYAPCTWSEYSDCVAKYCNWKGVCNTLDSDVKPAAKFFVDQLDHRYDRVGLVVYDQYGRKASDLAVGLTNDFTAVKNAIDKLTAFEQQQSGNPSTDCPITNPPTCSKQTNIGDGIMYAHTYIAGEGRMDAIWSMVLLTDGKANVYRECPGCTPAITCPTGKVCWCSSEPCARAESWANYNAKETWDMHEVVIYTIAYGEVWQNYKDLMIDIADRTDNGKLDGSTTETTGNFYGVPDGAELMDAFAEIAQRIYSRLLK